MASRSQEEEAPNIRKRRLVGNHCVYHLDNQNGVEQFPLEETTLLNFQGYSVSVPGRRIAVNKKFISFALDSGTIRVIIKNDPSKSCLLEGITGSVTDMVFFSEAVDMLASISSGGLLYIWKITEDKDKELSQNITGCIHMAVRISGESDTVHPRVCWHCVKEESLVVGIGRSILRLNIPKVKKNSHTYSNNAWEVTRQSSGVHYVGGHDWEVTDLSMCWQNKAFWVSAANDGTIKIWAENDTKTIAELRLDKAVISAKFITSPWPKHIILVTGASSSGPREGEVEVKIWTSTAEDGRLDTDAGVSLHCTQTLVLKSSARADDVLFDQVLAIPQPGLLLLANAKNKTVYTIHLEYGHIPAATRMDYITEFTFTMPKLSITGSSDLLSCGKRVVQLYCVLTRAINRYELDLSCCSPPQTESLSLALPSDNREDNVQQLQYLQKTLSRLIIMQEGMEKNISAMQNMQKETREDTVQQLQYLEKTQSLLITMQEGMEKNFSAMQDVQKEIQKQIAGQMFVHQPLALVVGDIINSALSIMADRGTSSFPDSQNACPISLYLKEILNYKILEADYENAFAIALKEGPAALCWLCSEVSVTSMMTNEAFSLSKDVLFGLLKHLASQTLNSIYPQMQWMKQITKAAKQVEPDDELINVSSILEEAYEMLLIIEMSLANKDSAAVEPKSTDKEDHPSTSS